MKIFVRNMTCESCKAVVRSALKVIGVTPVDVSLGEIEVKENLTQVQLQQLNSKIEHVGLELIEKKNLFLCEKIKHFIIDYVYKITSKPITKFSALISKALNYDYAYLSSFFSEVEASTIEKYIISLKIERIKELIMFDEHTIAEIAYLLHYSSPAHLSNQFKKVTGLNPSEFKALKQNRRIGLQEIL